ncbi:site-specific integrase [Plantactinospora mayteni]|uniref:Integrase n=1 Tax=Plantactinospora mayteni TaxID=566021 RepID=A0ABQ4EK45_9ACTN|nr:tyrosine-type recombinase/integrase [Plantactinospora mayteni]GIG94591.1 integrase [Plantactinospora mayteni]
MGVREELLEGCGGLPQLGEVVATGRGSLPFALVDCAGAEVEAVSRFLRDLALSDCSPLTVRSYAMDLLRWWRILVALQVDWQQATADEVAVMVGWLRSAPNPQRRPAADHAAVNPRTGKPLLQAGYARATINHALSVVSAFYTFHAQHGRGPVVNPVPVSPRRRALLSHRGPMVPVPVRRRAPLRQKQPDAPPRAIPDLLWDELFAALSCVRDQALMALFVSSAARASELLGLTGDRVDWAGQRFWVVSKGSRLVEPVPASPQALTLLALYLDEAGLPAPGQPVWRTLRGEPRPLSYWALRRMLQRVNTRLGTNWTFHDLRHTAATRMANDSALTLPQVQTILRHRNIADTLRYVRTDIDELFSRLQQHFRRPRVEQIRPAAGYAAEDMAVVFGG